MNILQKFTRHLLKKVANPELTPPLLVHDARNPFEVLLLGDTSFCESTQDRHEREGRGHILKERGYSYPLSKMRDTLLNANLVIANLEAPLTNLRISPFKNKKKYILYSDPIQCPDTFLKHNIQIVNLANNHAFDFGRRGFLETLKALKKHRITYFGGGISDIEADTPLVRQIKIGGHTITFAVIPGFEYSKTYKEKFEVYASKNKSGITELSISRISLLIKKLRKVDPNTVIVCYPHWHQCDYQWKKEKSVFIARHLVESGVDYVIGHGSHTLQEIEKINGDWVLFSLGNFVFNTLGKTHKHLNPPPYSLISKLIFEAIKKEVWVSMRVYPILTDNNVVNYQPRYVYKDEFNDVLRLLNKKKSLPETNITTLHTGKDTYGYYIEFPKKLVTKKI